jgi:hypothetical protein
MNAADRIVPSGLATFLPASGGAAPFQMKWQDTEPSGP